MADLFKNPVFKKVLISILLVSVVLVVFIGKAKQNQESKKWKAVLNKMEMSNKASGEADVKNTTDPADKEKQQDTAKEQTAETDIYKGAKKITASDNNRWKNKNWYVLGDNITAGNGYQPKVKAALSMSNVITDATIGKVMADMAANINGDKLKGIDLVTVFAGTADYSLDTPLGTVNDNENSNTFYGNIHKTIKKIVNSNADTTIVFFTPLKRGAYKNYPVYPNANKAGVKLEDYVQAIKDVCKTYNILVYDLFNESGINQNNLTSYTTDNLNLNATGYTRITSLITGYLKTVGLQ